jgi:hypothetical protein
VKDFKVFAMKNGADRSWIKSAQVINQDRLIDIIPRNDQFSRYNPDPEGKLNTKARIRNQCRRLWRTCVVTTDGNIVPCCFDKEAKYIMGSKEIKLSEIGRMKI